MFKNRQILPLLLLIALTGCNSAWKPKWLSRLRPQSENRKVAERQAEDEQQGDDEDPAASSSNHDSPRNNSGKVSAVSQSTDDELAQVERHAHMIRNAQNALRQQRIEDASKIYRDVLNEAPENPDAHHGLAMASDLDEDWGDAEYHYKQALRIRPRDAVILSDLGYSYILQNRFAEAARYLNQAIELQPNYERAHTNLALLDLKQGNRAAAEQRLVKRLGNSPQTTEILESLQQQASESATPPSSAVANLPPSADPAPPKSTTAPAHSDPPTAQITQNMSLEEVQELARRERELAQQSRNEQAPNPSAPPATLPPQNTTNPARLSLANPNSHAWPPANSPHPNVGPDTLILPHQPQPSWSNTASQAAPNVALTPPVPIRSSSSGTTAGAESYGQPAGFNRSLPSRMRITESPPPQITPNSLSSYPQPLRTEGLNIGPGSLFPVFDNSRTNVPDTGASRKVQPAGYTQPEQFQPTTQHSPNQYRLIQPANTSANTATAQYPAAWPANSGTGSQAQSPTYGTSQP